MENSTRKGIEMKEGQKITRMAETDDPPNGLVIVAKVIAAAILVVVLIAAGIVLAVYVIK